MVLLFSLSHMCCAVKLDTPTTTGTIDNYQIQSGSNFSKETASELSGSGTLLFLSTLTTKSSFRLQFQLNNSSSLSLIAFSDSLLNDGFKITFSRDDLNIKVKLWLNDDWIDLSQVPGIKTQNASEVLTYDIEINSTNSNQKVLIWDRNLTSSTDPDLAIYQSSETYAGVDPLPIQSVSGKKWGISLQNATLTQAQFTSE